MRPDVGDELRRIEEAHTDDIAALVLFGHNIWPALRPLLAAQLIEARERGRAAPAAAPTPVGAAIDVAHRLLAHGRRSLALAARSSTELAALSARRSAKPVLVRTLTYSRRDEIDGARWCVFFDPVVAALGVQHFTISEGRGFPEDDYAERTPHRVDFHDDVVVRIAHAFALRHARHIRNASATLTAIAARIAPSLAPLVSAQVGRFIAGFHAWRLVYRALRPRVALVTVGVAGREPEIAAARSLGVRVVEMQHGEILPGDRGYMFSDALRLLRPTFALADELLVFSRHQRDVLVRAGFWLDDDVRVVGSPRLTMHLGRAPRPSTPRAARDHRVVLVTPNPVAPIPTALRAFIARFLERHPVTCCRFHVKPHPIEPTAPWHELARRFPGRVVVVDGNLYTLLADSDVVLAVYTSVMREGLFFGVPAYILACEPWWREERAVVDGGGARVIDADYDGELEPFDVPASERTRYLEPLDVDAIGRALRLSAARW